MRPGGGPDQNEIGTVHMVGVHPDHRGRRLGWAVTLAVLHWFAARGFERARLLTDDWRHPAIRVYLGLGFLPVLIDAEHRNRWHDVFTAIGRPFPEESLPSAIA